MQAAPLELDEDDELLALDEDDELLELVDVLDVDEDAPALDDNVLELEETIAEDDVPGLDDVLAVASDVLDEDEELRAEVSPLVDDELPELPDDAPQHAAK